jgi:DNA-binding HxlR family transcriptional regulator
VHEENCPLSPIVALFGGRWKTEILWRLEDGPCRFNQLKRTIPGISQKMLAQQLRQLERDGIVRREHFPEVPPRVEYSLTPLGRSLQPVFTKLGTWGRHHMDEVLAARESYDTRTTPLRESAV